MGDPAGINTMNESSVSPMVGISGGEARSIPIRARGYQLEMLEASMKENIIVAMDTGSGKTHVAVLRIKAELETCPAHKIVWFLAPTVALCFQQHEVLAGQIPHAKTRTLTGMDNVDRWTEQSVWDKVLQDVRIVVSTHAVLSDALNHGFVKMSQLAFIVFDEAHHCMRRHPANKIMQMHYHPLLTEFGPNAVPKILGLTASPIVRSKQAELSLIEANLDAVCKTPRVNRTELLECVHRPHLQRLSFAPIESNELGSESRLFQQLENCVRQYDIQDDPYIEMLRRDPDRLAEAEELAVLGKTFCYQQLIKFLERSIHIYKELGGWATDFFINASVRQFRQSLEGDSDKKLEGIDHAERVYLLGLLSSLPLSEGLPESIGEDSDYPISPKLARLLEYLDQMNQPEFSAIIFAKRRVVVAVLAHILSIHPRTADKFRCAPYVGWSSHKNRTDFLGDLICRDLQQNTLSEFRAGTKNLIVATDVLEEGLDISSCSLVICFDRPANLKSFVQRRGRARRQESTYSIMTSIKDDDDNVSLAQWQQLEQVMIETYQNDERRREEAAEVENQEEEVPLRLFVPSSSACLSANESMQHLYHFCSLLPHSKNTDSRPLFIFDEDPSGRVRATVNLPTTVHPAVRRAEGQQWWRSERAATKEAAFRAYKALWEYGLVNDNLLPVITKSTLEMSQAMAEPIKASTVLASGQCDPYVPLAQSWTTSDKFYQTQITFSCNGVVDESLTTSMVLPMEVITPDGLTLYWSLDRQLEVKFSSPKVLTDITPEQIATMRKITTLLFMAPRSRAAPLPGEDYVVPFIPYIDPYQWEDWLHDNEGTELISDMFNRDPDTLPNGFVRDTSSFAEARMFLSWTVDSNPNNKSSKSLSIECQSLPQRRNLLNPKTMYHKSELNGEPAHPPKIQAIPAAGCTCSRIPAQTGVVGRFFSAILDRFEATLVAKELANTILKSVDFQNISHVLTAITMPIAQAATDYQRYEFFGDSVLKFTVACQLFYAHPEWAESRLSPERDKFISNSNLTQSALLSGIEPFILGERFTPTNWSAPLITEKMTRDIPQRRISTKVIADAVESLIGAAYMDGGMEKAQKCLYRLIPQVDILQGDLPSPETLRTGKVSDVDYSPSVHLLLDYTFTDPFLLKEALTHASGSRDGSQSYNRLEYLGDAVLDVIIFSTLASLPQKIPEGRMTLLKHTCTNGNFLAFLCMTLCYEPEQQPGSESDPQKIHLYDLLHFNGDVTDKSRAATVKRYEVHKEETLQALKHGQEYPWLPLAQIHPDKFFSDIIESTIGAIFVDSRGDLEKCARFAHRVGILPTLCRFVDDEVNVQHPRNKAQGILKENRSVQFKVTGALNSYTCTTLYGLLGKELKPIAAVNKIAFREEAEIRAAQSAIPLLYQKEAEFAESDEKAKVARTASRQQSAKERKKRKREARAAEKSQKGGKQRSEDSETGGRRSTTDSA